MPGSAKYDVCFNHASNDHDTKISEEIQERLVEKGFNCKMCHPGEKNKEHISTGAQHSTKFLILVSRAWCKSKDATAERSCGLLMDRNKVNNVFVCVEDDFTEDDPEYKKDLQHEIQLTQGRQGRLLRYKDTDEFWDELCAKLKRETSILDAAPSGDVAYGMCWTYFYGYLNIVLPELEDGLRKWKEANDVPKDVRLVPQLFVVCPVSYQEGNPADLTAFKNIRYHEKPEIEIKKPRAGNYRSYDLLMHEVIGANGEKFYVPMTNNWSLVHISKMKNDDFFGITQDQLENQNRIFIDKLTNVLKRKGLHGKVQLVEVGSEHMADLAHLLAKRCEEALAMPE